MAVNDLLASLSVKISGDVQNFEAALKKGRSAMTGFVGNVNTDIRKSYLEFDKFERTFQRGFGRMADTAKNVGRSLTIGVTAPLTALGYASLKSYAELSKLQNSLTQIAGSTEVGAKQFKALEQSARLPGLSLNQAVKASIRLQSVGIEAEKARKTIEQLANANTLVGGGAEEFDRLIYGFQQLANTDFPLGEDLNIVKDALPQVNKLLNDAFGTARAEELRKLGITSKQITDTIVEGLSRGPRAASTLGTAYEKLQGTINKALAKIGESLDKNFNLTERLQQAEKTIESLAAAFSQLTPGTQATITSFALVAAATGPVLFGLGAITKAIPTLIAGFNALKATAIGTFNVLKGGGPLIIAAGLIAASSIEEPGREAEQKRLNDVALQSYNESISKFEKQSTERLKQLKEKLGKEYRAAVFDSFRSGSGTDADAAKIVSEQLSGQITAITDVIQKRNQGIADSYTKTADKIKEGNDKITSALADIYKQLADAGTLSKIFGTETDLLSTKVGILENGIESLVRLGLKPQNEELQKLINLYNTLGSSDFETFKKATAGVAPISPTGIDETAITPQVPEGALKSLEDFSNGVGAVAEKIKADIKSLNEGLMSVGTGLSEKLDMVFMDMVASTANGLGDFAESIASGEKSAEEAGKTLITGLARALGSSLVSMGTALLPTPLAASGAAMIAAGIAMRFIAGSLGRGGMAPASSGRAAPVQGGFSGAQGSSSIRMENVDTGSTTIAGSKVETLNLTGRLVIADEGGALVGYINRQAQKQSKTGG